MRVGWEESRTCGCSRTVPECHTGLSVLPRETSLWMAQGGISSLNSKELTILGWPGLSGEGMHLLEWVCSSRSQDTAQEMGLARGPEQPPECLPARRLCEVLNEVLVLPTQRGRVSLESDLAFKTSRVSLESCLHLSESVFSSRRE